MDDAPDASIVNPEGQDCPAAEEVRSASDHDQWVRVWIDRQLEESTGQLLEPVEIRRAETLARV